jgi:organic radical activating enzyme
MTDIHHVQNNSYSVLCKGEPVAVKFVIAELPNDMKMLAFLGGEPTNSATYFSTFADVSKDSIVNCKGTFGPQPTDTWKPWLYTKRVKDADAVKKFKKKLNQNLSSNTKRNKVTAFIAKQKSRQEFTPLVAELISKAHIEPLHLKNNACALAFST